MKRVKELLVATFGIALALLAGLILLTAVPARADGSGCNIGASCSIYRSGWYSSGHCDGFVSNGEWYCGCVTTGQGNQSQLACQGPPS